jgi:type VI secretion system protein
MSRSQGQGSLFERLDPEASPRQSMSRLDHTAERIRAVKKHLEQLLNARQGCSSSSPGFGLSDFNDAAMGSADLLIRISADIRQSIEIFEPRVKIRDVHFRADADHPQELNFRLDCVVPVESREEVVEIDLVMNSHDRHMRVI